MSDISKEQRLNKKEQKMQAILFIPIIISLAIVPLIVRLKIVESSQEVYELLKNDQIIDFYSQYKAIFIMLISVIMIGMLFLMFEKQKVKKDRKTMIYSVVILIFLVFSVLSTLFSPYKNIAITGAPDRAEGMIVILCYIVMMFYTIYAFHNFECYKYITIALEFLVVVTTIIGISQYIGRDILISNVGSLFIIPNEYAEIRENLVNNFSKARITGTMYNPNYIGSFAAMVIPFFAASIITAKGLIKKLAAGFMALCSIFLLFGSGSRGGMLGVAAAIIVLCIIFLKKGWEKKKIVLPIIVGVFVVILGLGVATKGIMFTKITTLVSDIITAVKPVDKNFDYRDYLPIRDIVMKDKKVTIITQQDSLTLANSTDNFLFTDGQGKKVDYTLTKNVYTTTDVRFSNLKFEVFFRQDDQTKIGGVGLVEDEKGIFVFKVTEQEGIELVDSYTQKKITIEQPETIGFKGKEKLGSSRGYIWSRSLPLLKKTIIVGNGPDTYFMVFPQRDYFGKYYAFDDPNKIVDKPHNLYLQIAINQGIIALIAFLTVMILYIANSMKLYALRSFYKQEDVIGIAIMTAIIGYLTAGIFNDSVVSVAPIFWILLGCGIAANYLVHHKRIEE